MSVLDRSWTWQSKELQDLEKKRAKLAAHDAEEAIVAICKEVVPQATAIEIELESESDDEGGSYWAIGSIYVTVDGKQVRLSNAIATRDGGGSDANEDNESDEDEEDVAYDASRKSDRVYDLFSDMAEVIAEYDLTQLDLS